VVYVLSFSSFVLFCVGARARGCLYWVLVVDGRRAGPL
jgi:hypothetical protein